MFVFVCKRLEHLHRRSFALYKLSLHYITLKNMQHKFSIVFDKSKIVQNVLNPNPNPAQMC